MRRGRSTGALPMRSSRQSTASASGRLASVRFQRSAEARPTAAASVAVRGLRLGGPPRVEVGAELGPVRRREVDRLRGQVGPRAELGAHLGEERLVRVRGDLGVPVASAGGWAPRRGRGRTAGPGDALASTFVRYLQLIIHTWSTRRSAGTTSSPGAWVGPFHSTSRGTAPRNPWSAARNAWPLAHAAANSCRWRPSPWRTSQPRPDRRGPRWRRPAPPARSRAWPRP